jgi:hypothetical protein
MEISSFLLRQEIEAKQKGLSFYSTLCPVDKGEAKQKLENKLEVSLGCSLSQ